LRFLIVFSRKGKTDIKVIRLDKGESCDGKYYLEILKTFMIDKGNSYYGYGKWRFVHDNARPHIIKEVRDLFAKEKVHLIDHPPWSPDLNAIEKLWNWLKDIVNMEEYENCDKLEAAIKKVWSKLMPARINKVIDHQIKNVAKVLENDGKYADE